MFGVRGFERLSPENSSPCYRLDINLLKYFYSFEGINTADRNEAIYDIDAESISLKVSHKNHSKTVAQLRR